MRRDTRNLASHLIIRYGDNFFLSLDKLSIRTNGFIRLIELIKMKILPLPEFDSIMYRAAVN